MNKDTWKYITEKSGQKILEWKTCKWTWEEYPIFGKEAEILDKISPVFNWKKYLLPYSNLSPKAREIRRMIWRNERNLFKRKCDLTHKDIITVYGPEYQWKVYYFKKYNSDIWSPFDYWVDLENISDIKDTINDFFLNTPARSLNLRDRMENCDYCNYGQSAKDCYMCQCPAMSENSMYSFTPLYSNYDVDSYLSEKSEITYESLYSIWTYKCFYCQDVSNSNDCYFSKDLKNCKNSIASVWLDGKEYYIFNKKVTKEEFENKLEDIFKDYSSVEKFKIEADNFISKFPKRNLINLSSENVVWNNIRYSKNIILWNNVIQLEDSLYCSVSWVASNNLKDCYASWINSSYVNEFIWMSDTFKSSFWIFASGTDSYYITWWKSDNSIFTIWLENQEYCIFNKKYSKAEYENKAPIIIEKLKEAWIWWEFFPVEFSPFPYNDSIANDNYPIKNIIFLDDNKKIIKEEINDIDWEWTVYVLEQNKSVSNAILDLGWEEKIKIKWRTNTNESEIPNWIKVIDASKLPEKISDINDDILNSIIICKQTNKPFKIIKQELDFYRKYNLPIPRLHPTARFKNRLKKLAKNDLSLVFCDKCNTQILSVWWKENVICEDCYLLEKY